MSLSDRLRPTSEAAPWVVDAIQKLEAEVALLRNALHCISLGSQNSMTNMADLGRRARKAIEDADKLNTPK
jgi:hypothetical protein